MEKIPKILSEDRFPVTNKIGHSYFLCFNIVYNSVVRLFVRQINNMT